jgi:hypothetical protein
MSSLTPTLLLTLVFSVSAFSQSRGAVSGQIRLPDGSPAAGVRVAAMAVPQDREDTDAALLDSIAETDSVGRYQLSDVTPGRYYVVAGALVAPTYHPGTSTTRGATILTVEPGSRATAVDFTISDRPVLPPTSVVRPLLTGKVVLEGGAPPPFFLGTLYITVSDGRSRSRFGEDGRKIRMTGTAAGTPVGRNGAFSLVLGDGEYGISLINSLGDSLSTSDGYYVKSMTFGTADILGQKFRVPRSSRSAITITLAKQPAK